MRYALLGLMLLGCGSTVKDAAKDTLNYSKTYLNTINTTYARLYTEQAKEALAKADADVYNYHRIMEPWDIGVTGLYIATNAVHTAEKALAAWEATGDASWFYNSAACLFEALYQVRDLLRALGVDTPDPYFNKALAIGKQFFAEGTCQSGL